jgi:hypothetical protein
MKQAIILYSKLISTLLLRFWRKNYNGQERI